MSSTRTPDQSTSPEGRTPPTFPAAGRGRSRAVNGTWLFSVTRGRGEPVVLVHGSWTDHRSWDLVAPRLARSCRVTAYDRSGHSASPRRPTGSTRRMDEDDLVALVEAAGTEPVHLVGNSYGASIALGVACRRPDLVRSLAIHEPPLIDVAARDPRLSARMATVRAELAEVAARLRGADVVNGLRYFIEEVALGPGSWILIPEDLRAAMAANHRTFLDVLDDPAWAELEPAELGRLVVPVLLSDGDQSPDWLPAACAALAGHIPHAQRVTFRGAGHAPHLTHADGYADALATFQHRSSSITR